MTARLPLYGPVPDREALNEAASAVRTLAIPGCPDLANKLSYLAGVRPSALDPSAIVNAIDLCTGVMSELAMQSDPSRYVMGDENWLAANEDLISEMVESRRRSRAIVGAARDQLKEMVGALLTV